MNAEKRHAGDAMLTAIYLRHVRRVSPPKVITHLRRYDIALATFLGQGAPAKSARDGYRRSRQPPAGAGSIRRYRRERDTSLGSRSSCESEPPHRDNPLA